MFRQRLNTYRGSGVAPPAIVIVLTVALFFCSAALADSGRPELTIGVGRDFFDGPDSRSYLHGSTNTWEGLTYLDGRLRAAPWLAESWESDIDGKIWTFKIRDGVFFHDGSPLTPQDAKTSIERIRSNPKYDQTGIYRNLVKIEASGSNLVFHLKEPCPDFPRLAAYYSSPIIKPSCILKDGKLSGLIATGPYQLESVHPGDKIVLKAFNRYWGEKPAFQKVVFKTILDAQTRAMALIAEEVDAVADVGAILPQQADDLRRTPGIILKKVEVATTHYILFNCRRAPFSDAESRKWLASLIDRGRLIHYFAPGAGKIAETPFTPLAADWSLKHLAFSNGVKPERTDKPLTIMLHSGTIERWPYRDIAQIIQEKLQTQGFDTSIIVKEPGAYYDSLKKGAFDLAMQPHTLMTGEPDFFYSYFIASDGPRNCGCGSGEIDGLIELGRTTVNEESRKRIYGELVDLISQQLPILPLYHDISFYAHNSKLEHFEMDHNFRPLLIGARPWRDR